MQNYKLPTTNIVTKEKVMKALSLEIYYNTSTFNKIYFDLDYGIFLNILFTN